MSKYRSWAEPPPHDPGLRRWLGEARHDLRYALRQHRRAPGFAVLVIVTLAIGIGANAAMFGAIDRLLLRAPAHVHDPNSVVRLLFAERNSTGDEVVSARSNYPTFLDFERAVASFESIAAYWSADVSFGEGPEAVEARASLVSASFFSVLGTSPVAGRFFIPDGDSRTGAAPIAVLGHAFWQREFAGDTSVIDRNVRIGGVTYTVVGVSPPGFNGAESEATDVWLPITVAAERTSRIPLYLEDRGSAWLSIVARLRPGATRAVAEQQATNVWRHQNARPGNREAGRVIAASVIPGRGADRPRETNVALWLAGVSALVLLIACANVGNLLLGRAFARRGEIAVRLALGAGRRRLARQMLVEAMVLAAFGGTFALYFAALGGRVVQRFLLSGSVAGNFLDRRLFLATAAIAIGTGMLISLAPLIQT
ncbi:MAG: ABC transporter permease, partial [Gemmatimonadaceae bacterium]